MKLENFLLIGGGIILMTILMGKKLVSDPIERMARAIMDFEGWFPDSRSARNNNPGNLRWPGNPYDLGAVSKDETNHLIFATFEGGWNALIRQLTLAFTGRSRVYSPEMTLQDFFRKYAEGNQIEYANHVAREFGVTPETRLSELV